MKEVDISGVQENVTFGEKKCVESGNSIGLDGNLRRSCFIQFLSENEVLTSK